MKVHLFIERYFWVFLLAGLLLGLTYPVYNDFLLLLLKPFLMGLMVIVFLKTGFTQIILKMKNYRLMAFLVCMYMAVLPVIFYLTVNLFNSEYAIGILLLTCMPAGAASPALTEIVKGNISLSTSILIITTIVAPFSIPLLFWVLKIGHLSINPLLVFKDLAIIVFLPLIISEIVKKYFPNTIAKGRQSFTTVNILILFLMVYAVMGSQRDIILNNPINLIGQTGFLYLMFIVLHVIGFLIGYNEDKESKVAITVGAAYMNNGMAIVLAKAYFGPSMLVLMVLSEFPWNTLLKPFRIVVKTYLHKA